MLCRSWWWRWSKKRQWKEEGRRRNSLKLCKLNKVDIGINETFVYFIQGDLGNIIGILGLQCLFIAERSLKKNIYIFTCMGQCCQTSIYPRPTYYPPAFSILPLFCVQDWPFQKIMVVDWLATQRSSARDLKLGTLSCELNNYNSIRIH